MSDYNRYQEEYSGGEDEVKSNQIGNEESALQTSYESDKPQSCFLLNPYLNREAAAKLKDYEYRGGDNSISARYFYKPFAEWCIKHTPEWIAPNVVSKKNTPKIENYLPFYFDYFS